MTRRESDVRLVLIVRDGRGEQYRNVSVAGLRKVLGADLKDRAEMLLGMSFSVDPSNLMFEWAAYLDLEGGRFAWADLVEDLVEGGHLDLGTGWVRDALDAALASRVLEA